MAYIYDLSDQWAASGTTFTGIKLSVTDTASAAGSSLMDLQVGGVSRFNVSKTGRLTVGSVGVSLGFMQFLEGAGVTFTLGSGSGVDTMSLLGGNGPCLRSDGAVFWSGSTSSTGSTDLQLRRDAADTLALRRGVNAQAFNLYNTYTDASNYERGFVKFSGGVFRVGTEKAGTGAATNSILVADNIPCFQWGGFGGGFATMNVSLASAAAGTYDLGAGNIGGAFRRLHLAQFVETFEMTAPAAPAANGVRIYAEDDGAGKTRLMARFATGASQQIAIEP